MNEQVEWLYIPNAKPSKELSKHDQRMIQLGWDAHKTFRLDRPDREKIADQYYNFTIKQGWKLAGFEADIRAKSYEYADLALIPDTEELDRIREEITRLNKKLDDREEDLITAKREEEERISRLIAQIEVDTNQVVNMAIKLGKP